LREADEPRRDGKRWYCSQSCFLQASSSSHAKWKPRRKWRRRILWTLGIIFGLFVGLIILGAVIGQPKKKDAARSPASAAQVSTAGANFGSRSRPVPVGTAASIGGGWWVKVDSATLNANRLFSQNPPPRGAQNVLVMLTLSYRGGGKDDASNLVNDILRVEGAHGVSYDEINDPCGTADASQPGLGDTGVVTWPRPSLQSAGEVFSNQSVRGNLCYTIAANDAKTLELFSTGVGNLIFSYPTIKKVWFAVR
jgi:hypothetical protein